MANRVNVGFAAAVNQAVTDSASRWIAVVNPDVEVHPDTLAATVEHLEQHPAVGSCGAPAVHADGTVSDRTFFMKPTGWSEITRALGAHRLAPASRLWNPEQSLAHQRADEPLGVDVIADCFNVIDRELFEHLGGYDEDYFLCGEDLDLSVRAVEAGAAPRWLQCRRSCTAPRAPSPPRPTPGSLTCGAGPSTSTAGGRPPTTFAGLVRRAAVLGRLGVLRLLRSGRSDELAHLWGRRDEWTDVTPANA